MKLLRTAVSSLEFSILTYSKYPNGSSSHAVWSIDGNLSYFHFPHILLFLVSVAILLFLWLSYTLLLLLMQWLWRLPSALFLKWIMCQNPLHDAYVLRPLQTQAPVLVWSAPAHSRISTRDICVHFCHPPKHQSCSISHFWNFSHVFYGCHTPLQE